MSLVNRAVLEHEVGFAVHCPTQGTGTGTAVLVRLPSVAPLAQDRSKGCIQSWTLVWELELFLNISWGLQCSALSEAQALQS